MGLRFLYKMWSKTKYTESLNTLDDREDQNYEENEGKTRLTGAHLKNRIKVYGRAENHLAQRPQWLLNENNIYFCYDR